MTATVPYRDLDELAGLLTGSAHLPEESRAYRMDGGDWPVNEDAVTMVGDKRLFHLREMIRQICDQAIPGDLIECGVWRGGACIYMRAVLNAHYRSERVVWVADSFQGCPEGDEHHGFEFLRVPQSEVEANFARYGLLDGRVRFVPGFFESSLAGPVGPLALLRIDCDMYDSTRVVLERLYPLVSPGGFIVCDDYKHLNTAKDAVDNFRKANGITEPMVIDPEVAYWRKN